MKMQPNKIIVAPDSFKGTLSSKQAAEIIANEITAFFPDCTVVKMPIADGGEGSVDTIIAALGGQIYSASVLSPDDRLIDASYGIATSKAAILEMAQSSGITKQTGLHPMSSSTYGFGQLILAALGQGAKEFVLCIGGSATTDGGCGMAAALGVRFFDERGNSFVPCGGTLSKIAKIDMSDTDKRIRESSFAVMCDVDNPLYGENGAAHVYSPQKGATPEQVLALDEGLRHLGDVLFGFFGIDHAGMPGAGAAGGLGAGCIAFLGAKLASGIEMILQLCDFEKHIADANLIITGEGKLDSQSFSGKVLSGLLRNAGRAPVWSICGVCDCDKETILRHGVTVFQACEGASASESLSDPEKYLRIAAGKAMMKLRNEETEK